ncbi:MAG TPA: peptidylprolyl isomerase [Acetobacteraceae bacterium]|jgi:peptidyl-prolyl cis-trans isomerase SurA|nr:peptidylprolyl isomerase [Acetobacteraceae bacterium]
MTPFRPLLLCAALAAAVPALAQPRQARPPVPQPAPAPQGEKIVAVINGDVITTGDVDNRGRLFALSTGLPVTPDVLDRLRQQVTKQLIDERLRLQEVQRRKIVVNDREIAEAMAEIEGRNNMPKGALAASLAGRGVALRTLIDQVRVQIGWTRVLREELGAKAEISDAEINDQRRLFKAQTGQPEYRVAEIFIPIDDPAKASDAQRFADTVIAQLRAGAPFPVVAAQFSQSQTALQGGDLGWVRANQLDPEVAAVVREMPPGAISNPVRVPGGISIVTLAGKRVIGRDQATVLSIRQVFLPFVGQLNPNAPTDQQRKAVEQAAAIAKSAKSCHDIEAANERAGKVRPSDPGEVRLEGVGSPPLRALLAGLQPNQPSRPVVASEGVAVLMVCSREQRTESEPSKQEISNQLLSERVELVSRQLQRDLRRRAVMDVRS